MKLSQRVIHFLEEKKVVIVSTLNAEGKIHCAVKGIVGIEQKGKVFLIDLYTHETFNNLRNNQTISITAVDEHKFQGYTLQGHARLIPRKEIHGHIVAEWERRILKRISTRMIKNIQASTKSKSHFEAELPSKPKYVIEIDVTDIIDLSPPLKESTG
ncbi:pyridoxamine 5'-phosphate oxidase family protein [Candidatus Omnitrophota bacterium]